MSTPITRDQTFTFDGVNYRAGRPIPKDVARKHGLIEAETSPGPEGNSLPTDFPAREQLTSAGFDTVGAVAAAADEDLLEVDGIGPARLKDIRDATANA